MSEKTEKATAYKLQKSREKGQVNKSMELTTSLSLLVLLGMISALWPKILAELQYLMRNLLKQATKTELSLDKMHELQHFILKSLSSLWLPIAMAGVLTVILSTILQTGPVWTSTPLIPDFKRLSMTQGFKKLCSLKTCFETLKSLIKLTTASILIYVLIKHQLPKILPLALNHPKYDAAPMMSILLNLIFKLLMLLTSLAILDKLYTNWNYSKINRMSKQEVKDEHKQRDGDPKIKAKIKQLHYQLRQKTASLKQVATADVVITNPTHLAIALKYDAKLMPAPKVVCKAQDNMAMEVKKLAKKHGVPIIENKLLARSLYENIALNQWISSDLFPLAAAIFRTIYQTKEKA
jgi:flagellar biosynthetic protein FlhB/flagellar biosynthetic protein FliR/FlhB